MSLDATTWARHQKVGKGPAKAVLMALADYANENFVTYPSVETLVAWTEQDRKTVLANLDRLKEGGWITDTGERAGRTRQVVVYVINVARGVEVRIGPRELLTGPNSEQFQNRNSTENGTVPNSTGNSPNFDEKQSQKPPETVPNLGHRTVVTVVTVGTKDKNKKHTHPAAPDACVDGTSEQGSTDEKPLNAKALVAEGVARQHAVDWLTLRKAKRLPLTPTAWGDVKSEATKCGMTPAQAVEHAVKAGWAGFKAKWLQAEGASSQAPPGAQSRGDAWSATPAGIERKAGEVGLYARPGESHAALAERVRSALTQRRAA
nr:helix-turn-helix domain-containing protein [Burkholderia sp. TSV86]